MKRYPKCGISSLDSSSKLECCYDLTSLQNYQQIKTDRIGELLIVRLISQDGREIKKMRENSGNCSQECKRPAIGKKL